jgi:hypothetical protein
VVVQKIGRILPAAGVVWSPYLVVGVAIRPEGYVPLACRLITLDIKSAFSVGSVSVGVWQMACRRVIKVGERVVKDLAGEHDL